MVTGASFSAQQEPPAPWAGGSCCTFTAREVFFPRRSPGKNAIGICSQRSCEFGVTGGGSTLRAQSRLRGTRDVQFRGWGGGLGGTFSAFGAALCGVELRWAGSFVTVYAGACARRDWGALCEREFSGRFGFRRVLVRSVLCSRGSGSTLGCWRSDPRSRQLRGVYRAWCRLFGWLGCELALLRPHFNVYLTLFYGRSVVLCV